MHAFIYGHGHGMVILATSNDAEMTSNHTKARVMLRVRV
jgi:hypothetical protein